MAELTTLQAVTGELSGYGEAAAVLSMQKADVRTWSYADLGGHVQRVAAGLLERGVERGENVALLGENSPEWIAACLGMIHGGIVPVPVDVQSPGESMEHVLNDSDARFIFTTGPHLERIERLNLERELNVILLDADEKDERSWLRLGNGESGTPPANAAVQPDDIAVLFYTSGTTGKPKGVPLTHRNLTFQMKAVREAKIVTQADRALLPLPLHHVYPFVLGMLAPASLGFPMVVPRSLTGPQIVRALREGEVTVVIGVPRLYRALLSGIESRVQGRGRMAAGIFSGVRGVSRLVRRSTGTRVGKRLMGPLHRQFGERVRMLTSGGSPLEPAVAERLQDMGWMVATGYGLTETSPLLTWNLPGEADYASAGRPVKGVELKVDPEAAPEGATTPEKAAGPGVGEVLAKGPGVFGGYRNLPEKTAEVLTEDGWYRTGDLGYFDRHGYLHLMGRVSTMIVTESGENIQPDDLEDAYSENPVLREVGVLQKENRLVALVVPEPAEVRRRLQEAGVEAEADAQAVRRVVREAVVERDRPLPSYQRLDDFAVTREPLPRTPLGKMRRHKLAERYEQAMRGEEPTAMRKGPIAIEDMASEDQSLLSDPAARQVWQWLTERYPDQPLTPDTSPQLDLGVDSMGWLDLTMEIGERAGVDLEDEAIGRIETVRDLLREAAAASERDGGRAVAPLEEPEQALNERQKRWLEPLGPVASAGASGMFAVNRALMRRLCRLEVEGRENLPRRGPMVLAANHVSSLDPSAIAAALEEDQRRRVYWGGWTGRTMRNAVRRVGSRLAQAVPIEPERAAISSLAFGAAVLKRGQVLVWFPEGERSPDGRLQRFRLGLGRLLEKYPVPVVPVWIEGTREAWPPGQRVPRPGSVRVVFGKPLEPGELERQGHGGDAAERMMEALHDHLAKLSGERRERPRAA